MTDPYRSSDDIKNTVLIDTNDVSIDIYYEGVSGMKCSAKILFEDTSHSVRWSSERAPVVYSNTGNDKYESALKSGALLRGYQCGDIFIPLHRVLDIKRTVKNYQKRIEVVVK